MKIRILGTSIQKYIKNYSFLKEKSDSFKVEYLKNKINILDAKNGEKIWEFPKSQTTFRQNLECWEIMGLVTYRQFKYYWKKELNSTTELMDHIKKNLLIKSSKDNLEKLRLGILLLIQHSSKKISNKELRGWKISQIKGTLSSEKLTKQLNQFYKKNFAKDVIFLAKLRKEIYNEINKEL